MKNQELLKVKQLSTLIGHFIRYWGLRKIHGEVWTVVYLVNKPMSGIEIGKLLKVSKALISPALKELEAEGLIKQVQSENSKTKRYEAEENVTKVIRDVLNRREKPMIENIFKSHSEVAKVSIESGELNLNRLQQMGLMIQFAQMGLETLFESEQALG